MRVTERYWPRPSKSERMVAVDRGERERDGDLRLVWSCSLPGLAPGETIDLAYSLELRIDPPSGLTFGRTTVTDDAPGDLVGASEPCRFGE